MKKFSAFECIGFGWETFKKRPWFFIGAYLLLVIVVGILSAALSQIGEAGHLVRLFTGIGRFIVDILAGMASISFVLKAHDDVEHVSLADFWRPHPFWKYIGATILLGLVTLAGFILLVIPGVIWGIMFGFAGYLVIDTGAWPVDAMKESKRITHGYKWELFLLGIISVLIVLLGFVCLLVGILVAYPIVSLAMTHAYRTLHSRAHTPAPQQTA